MVLNPFLFALMMDKFMLYNKVSLCMLFAQTILFSIEEAREKVNNRLEVWNNLMSPKNLD